MLKMLKPNLRMNVTRRTQPHWRIYARLLYVTSIERTLTCRQDSLANDSKTWKTQYDDTAKGQEKRRTDKAARDKKLQDALDKLVAAQEEAKKKQVTDEKKPGTQAILDALKWVTFPQWSADNQDFGRRSSCILEEVGSRNHRSQFEST